MGPGGRGVAMSVEGPACFRFESAVYFDEMDPLGVMHNSRFAVHVERAQSALFEELGYGWTDLSERHEDIGYVVRDIALGVHCTRVVAGRHVCGGDCGPTGANQRHVGVPLRRWRHPRGQRHAGGREGGRFRAARPVDRCVPGPVRLAGHWYAGAAAVIADLLLTDATVLTMAPQGSGVAPRAGAVALLGGRIVYVGPDDAGLTARRTVSLGGRCVVPGFHDAHQHMAWFGASLDEIDLSTPPVGSLEDVAAAIAAAVASTPADRWIVGNGYDENKIGGHPDRDLLERVAPGRRVLLTHTSGHMSVVSSAVLGELGIADRGCDVPGGTVVVDASGRPTGLLQEQAQNLLAPLRRPLAVDDVADAVARASDVYVQQGITSVVEAGVGGGWIGRTPVEVLAYQRASDAGRLSVRVELMVASAVLHALGGNDADDLGDGIDLGLRSGFGDDRLRLGPVKVFSDGSLIGHTAAMCSEFSDSPGVRGYLQDDAGALVDTIVSAHRSGWRVATHAIGDSAIDLVLDAYERCIRDYPRTGWGGRAGNPRRGTGSSTSASPGPIRWSGPRNSGSCRCRRGGSSARSATACGVRWGRNVLRGPTATPRCWRRGSSCREAAIAQSLMAGPCWASTTW